MEKNLLLEKDGNIDSMLDYLIDPITGIPARGQHAIGATVLHVDDLFVTGKDELHSTILARLRKGFQIGSEDIQNVAFTGQRARWMKNVLGSTKTKR